MAFLGRVHSVTTGRFQEPKFHRPLFGGNARNNLLPVKTLHNSLILAGLLGLAGTLSAADAVPKDDVLAAAKKLAASSNYS